MSARQNDRLMARVGNPKVQRTTESKFVGCDMYDPATKAMSDRYRRIGGARINKNNFSLNPLLLPDSGQQFGHKAFLIEGPDDDGALL